MQAVDICPTHKLALIPTRSGGHTLCPSYECNFYKENTDMTKVTIPANATKEQRAKAIEEAAKAKKAKESKQVAPGSKDARKEEATKEGVVKPSKPERKVKIPKDLNKTRVDNTDTVTEKPTSAQDVQKGADKELDANVKPKKKEKADPNLLSVSDVARNIGMDPKQARAKLRRDGSRAPDGRWPKVRIDSQEYQALVSFLQGEQDDEDESKEKASKKLAKKKTPAKDEPEDDDEDESNEDAEDEEEDDDDGE